MKLQEIKEIAQRMEIAPKKMTKVELIRAIQEKEENIQCFETGKATTCGQVNCTWMSDCK